MTIDPSDKYIKHLIILTNMDEESRKRLEADAEEHYGSPWSLTLRDFFALSEGDLTYIGLTKETEIEASVRQYIWSQMFADMVQQVTAILQKLQVPQTEDAKRASEFCIKSSIKEHAIVFARKYFGLRNFTEAEEITIADFIVAKKDEFNAAMFQHAMNEIQRNKIKKK